MPFAMLPVDNLSLDIIPALDCMLQGQFIAKMLIDIEPPDDILSLYPPMEVIVDMAVPSTVANMDRWTAFQRAAAAGTPDEVTLYLIYPEAASALRLRFDGEKYLLEDEGRETAFRYLLVSEETDPPPAALYRSATHFLLSDDPEMTCERYFAHMVSSASDPDFPRTRSLFTVYHDK